MGGNLGGHFGVDDHCFVFVHNSKVKINAQRAKSNIEWKRNKAFRLVPRLVPRFDLHTPTGSIRFYLGGRALVQIRRSDLRSVDDSLVSGPSLKGVEYSWKT